MPPASNPQQETRDAPSSDIVAPVGAEHNTLYVAIEISRKSWVVGIKSPASERIGLHSLGAADVVGLKDLIENQQTKAERALGREVRVLCCYEAGYEGFWLARFGKRPAEWGLAAMPGRASSMAPAPAVREVMRSQRRKSRILGAYGPPNPTDRDGEVKKSDVVSHVASRVSLSRAQANVAVDAMFEVIGEALAKNEDVWIAGFGTFTTKSRPVRAGRNPRTGESVSIPASGSLAVEGGDDEVRSHQLECGGRVHKCTGVCRVGDFDLDKFTSDSAIC